MDHIHAIGPERVRDTLSLFDTLPATLTAEQTDALIDEQGWTIAARTRKTIIADAPWAPDQGTFTLRLPNGVLNEIYAGVIGADSYDDAAADAAVDAFADAVAAARQRWGPEAGRRVGDHPRAWWQLPYAGILIGRFQSAVTVGWADVERHEEMVRSIMEEDGDES